MLEMRLEELFTPSLLKAFREQWSADPDLAEEDARDIVRILTNPAGREAEVAKLVLALVGRKPNFYAWAESFATGSYELRPNVQYAFHGRRGMQPARFFDDQQKRIDRLAHEDLSPAEAAEWRNAYEDAMRLIIATQVLKEMRVGVAAKAALWLAWPLMVAVHDKRFGLTQQKLLAYFAYDPAFIDFCRERLGEILEDWIEVGCDGVTPSTRHMTQAGLFHRPSEAEMREVLRPAETYRSNLLDGIGLAAFVKDCGRSNDIDPKEQAYEDSKRLNAIFSVGGYLPCEEFTAFNRELHSFDYSYEDIEKIRDLLPVLATENADSPHFRAAARRGDARSKLLESCCAAPTLVGQIHHWVSQFRFPPPDLCALHAPIFEDAMCSLLCRGSGEFDLEWLELGFPEVNRQITVKDLYFDDPDPDYLSEPFPLS